MDDDEKAQISTLAEAFGYEGSVTVTRIYEMAEEGFIITTSYGTVRIVADSCCCVSLTIDNGEEGEDELNNG